MHLVQALPNGLKLGRAPGRVVQLGIGDKNFAYPRGRVEKQEAAQARVAAGVAHAAVAAVGPEQALVGLGGVEVQGRAARRKLRPEQ